MRKIILVLTAFVLLMTMAFPTFASSSPELRMMGLEEGTRDWEDHLFFDRMEEKTGVRFEFVQYRDEAAYREALSLLNPGDPRVPDVFFKAALLPEEMISLYHQGVLLDLRPYLEENMPNFYALLKKDPALLAAISLPNGEIVSLPFITEPAAQNILWINQAWLDALGLDMPENAKELEQTLQSFKTGDPNRNGRQDEIPLSFSGPYDLKYLAHAFGLAANDFNLFLQDDQARFMPLEKEFRLFIRWCRDLFKQGLLDPNGFTTVDALRRITDENAANRLGAFFSPLPGNLVPFEWVSQYRAVPPLQFEGKSVYRTISGSAFNGAFALSTACQNVSAALTWADTLYSQEGAVLAGIGLVGEDYVFDGDGTWRLLRDPAQDEYLSRVAIADGHSAPGLSTDQFQRLYADPMVRYLSDQVAAVASVARDPFPVFPLSSAEREAIAPLQAALGRYVDESIARFVLGETEVTDEAFAAFEQELITLGVHEFVALWQDAYRGRSFHDGV